MGKAPALAVPDFELVVILVATGKKEKKRKSIRKAYWTNNLFLINGRKKTQSSIHVHKRLVSILTIYNGDGLKEKLFFLCSSN